MTKEGPDPDAAAPLGGPLQRPSKQPTPSNPEGPRADWKQHMLTEGERIAHLGSWEYVVATRAMMWSDEQKRIYGLAPSDPSPGYDEVLRTRIHPDDAAALDRAFRAALQARAVFEKEHRIVRPDGSVRFIYDKAQPCLDEKGRLRGCVGVTLDITERRQAELVRAHLAAIVESSTDAITAIDLNGVITAWAPGAERLYGYSAAEAVGQPLTLIVPRGRRSEMAELIKKVRRGDSIIGLETMRVCKNGRHVAVSVTISPVRDATGQIVGSSGISRDMSERKRLERQLLEVGEREQQRIGHDLHDVLGQELHGLCYMARLLERELQDELPGRAPEARRMAGLLGEAFSLTRNLAHGLQPVSPIPDGLMVTLRNLARRTRDWYGVDCRFQCPKPVLIHHHGAATHLYRIAQEAVNNAIKHGRPTVVLIQLAATPQAISLGVRDNGVGISPKKAEACGMGLHIMKYRADAIRASLLVQRHPKGGTEMVCTVARQALQAAEENQHANPSAC